MCELWTNSSNPICKHGWKVTKKPSILLDKEASLDRLQLAIISIDSKNKISTNTLLLSICKLMEVTIVKSQDCL